MFRFTPKYFILCLALIIRVAAASPPDSLRKSHHPEAVKKVQVTQKTDSLETLHFLLSSEMKPQNRVWFLKSGKLVDSLSHLSGKVRWEEWDKVIQDSSIAVEMKSSDDFQSYWRKIEQREGISDLKGQVLSQDVVKSRIPKLILFDSTLIVYPGWIVLLKH